MKTQSFQYVGEGIPIQIKNTNNPEDPGTYDR